MQPHDTTPDGAHLKRCPKCKEEKPATAQYFSIDRKRRDGLYPYCKECDRAEKNQRNYQWQPPTDPSEIVIKFCPKCSNGYPATPEFFVRRQTNSDGLYTYCKACRDADAKKWAQENREKRRIIERRWYENHPTYSKEYAKRHRKLKPEMARGRKLRRQERERAAEGTHTAADIQRQYDAQKGRCYYCNCELDGKHHTDHVIPLSRGGSDGPENIVVACAPCNQSKGAKLPSEWDGSNKLL